METSTPGAFFGGPSRHLRAEQGVGDHLLSTRPAEPMTDPNGAAIYGVPWIPSIYPSHVSIYTSTMDPSWGGISGDGAIESGTLTNKKYMGMYIIYI